jgi:transglutaminase-like putative cysteine protease
MISWLVGEIPGYHCWSEFYVDGIGWIPVDASEAFKNPAKKDYFFGALVVNRAVFTYERDIRLSADQKGDSLPTDYEALRRRAHCLIRTLDLRQVCRVLTPSVF